MATATMVLNYDTVFAPRIVASYGRRLNLGRDATAAECKARVLSLLVQDVLEEEQSFASANAKAAVTPIVVT